MRTLIALHHGRAQAEKGQSKTKYEKTSFLILPRAQNLPSLLFLPNPKDFANPKTKLDLISFIQIAFEKFVESRNYGGR